LKKRITSAERRWIVRVIRLGQQIGCVACGSTEKIRAHHCGTAMGLAKDHSAVIPVCLDHHIDEPGGCTLSRREWEEAYGTEESHINAVRRNLT